MSLEDLLRDYARQDLQRFCPANHYLLRDHNPIADLQLTEPLLREPVRFGLTPRERVAATALNDFALYTNRSRAIFTEAHPARDIDDPTPVPGMTLNQEREILARYEVFRRSALVYARMLDDAQLIEYFHQPEQADTSSLQSTPSTTPVSRTSAQDAAILEEIKKNGLEPSQLPNIQKGKPGIKAACWGVLQAHTKIFQSRKVFDTAWERLSANRKIGYQKN